MRGHVLIEVCVDTAVGLRAAIAGGGDRIELCAALDLGGLTPGPGLIDMARGLPVPVRAMVRPRAGGFVFDHDEQAMMLHEIDIIRAAGLAGVVLGATTAAGTLDIPLLRELADRAAGLERTLHRAVDLVADPVAVVEAAIALGFDTILTSGGATTAVAGAERIARMRAQAAGRIEILPGSGIDADTAPALVAATGVTSVHASCRRAMPSTDPRAVDLGFAPATDRATDRVLVARLRDALNPQTSHATGRTSIA